MPSETYAKEQQQTSLVLVFDDYGAKRARGKGGRKECVEIQKGKNKKPDALLKE